MIPWAREPEYLSQVRIFKLHRSIIFISVTRVVKEDVLSHAAAIVAGLGQVRQIRSQRHCIMLSASWPLDTTRPRLMLPQAVARVLLIPGLALSLFPVLPRLFACAPGVSSAIGLTVGHYETHETCVGRCGSALLLAVSRWSDCAHDDTSGFVDYGGSLAKLRTHGIDHLTWYDEGTGMRRAG
ncbi:hypothetical protein GQ602_004783 [Ophiocordyceps camponoti-floridani]|uniref:Uncharacterized protein n=1 Tax=Ophiocordyceps camponoti-floridani TaxID=2030778 RepID=A0A8H4Q4F8_9HYPO|nr:hypothetical protein GQ602_004783 [Ophiocordyceps camponoti-floridani]